MGRILSSEDIRFRKQFMKDMLVVAQKALFAVIEEGKSAARVEVAFQKPNETQKRTLRILIVDQVVGQPDPSEAKHVMQPSEGQERVTLAECAQRLGVTPAKAKEMVREDYNKLLLVKSEYEELLGEIIQEDSN